MKQQKQYQLLIKASFLSTLTAEELESKLVASLYDIETEEKISDGDDEIFEILDYDFTDVIETD